jgi:CSLREA domain-containing protein
MMRRSACFTATLAVALSLLPGAAHAATSINVDTVTDTVTAGNCSLRAAINYANATTSSQITAGTNGCASQAGNLFPAGAVTIDVPSQTVHYVLTSGELLITGAEAITISGAGATSTILDGNAASRIFDIGPGSGTNVPNVTISNVEITNGNPGKVNITTNLVYGVDGGAILNQGKLSLSQVTLANNHTSAGALCPGGCPSQSYYYYKESTGNGGDGGAIFNDGKATLTITGSTISGNSTGGSGNALNGPDGVGVAPGSATSAPPPGTNGGYGGSGGSGGAIANMGTLTITGTTLSGNRTGSGGNGGNGGAGALGNWGSGFNACVSGQSFWPGGRGGDAGGGGGPGAGGAIFSATSTPNQYLDTNPSKTETYSGALGTFSIGDSSITGNSTGNGGNGGNGGSGGDSGPNGANGTDLEGSNGGNGGNGYQGAGATYVNYDYRYATQPTAPAGGAIFTDSPGASASITKTTISGNTTGNGGGGGNGGRGGHPGTTCGAPYAAGTPGSAANGGTGGGAGGIGFDSSSGATILTIGNSTISGNSVGTGGGPGTSGSNVGGGSPPTAGPVGIAGGLNVDYNGQLTLKQDTISSNTGGGVYAMDGSALQVSNSVIASNTAAIGAPSTQPHGNCLKDTATSTTFSDQGFNVYGGDNSGCPTGGSNSIQTSNAGLASAGLTDNGGPEQTVGLTGSSPAVDRIPINNCPFSTDERGIPRPQGPACDSGAYEYAPPAISGAAASVGSTTAATITASVNPNLSSQNTTVTVKYGTSTSYGTTIAPKDLGNGSTAVAFSAGLSGLVAGTTYHYEIVATNGDGTSTTADSTFITTSGQSASAGGATTSGSKLTLTVSCGGGDSGAICTGPITLTSHVTTQGKTVVAVAASVAKKKHKKRKPKPKPKVTTVQTVGGGSYSVASGHTQIVTLNLNRTGLKLLAQFYRLPVTVTLGGPSSAKLTMTFSYPRIKSVFTYLAHDNGTDVFSQLSVVGGVLPGGAVSMICAKGGCSPRHAKFKLKGKNIKHSSAPFLTLRPHAIAYLEITKAGYVGKVLKITNPGHGSEIDTVLCLPPGARKPSKCAR